MDRLKLMETFTVVMRLGSYTGAAKELGVTRAMVSRRLQDLEEILGIKLLNRNTRRLSPTGAGEDYFGACIDIIQAIRYAEDRISSKRIGAKGELKILCSKTFGERLFATIVAEFCSLHPNVSVQVTLADMRPDSNEIISRGFDFAIRTLPVGDSQVVARPIARLPRVLVASPDYLKRKGVPAEPEQLTEHNCLDPRGALNFSWKFISGSKPKTVKLSGSPVANSSMMIKQAALHGLGIAMMRLYLVQENLADKSLVTVLEHSMLDDDCLYVVYQKDKYQPTRAKLFIDFLTHRAKELLPPDGRQTRGNLASRRNAVPSTLR